VEEPGGVVVKRVLEEPGDVGLEGDLVGEVVVVVRGDLVGEEITAASLPLRVFFCGCIVTTSPPLPPNDVKHRFKT